MPQVHFVQQSLKYLLAVICRELQLFTSSDNYLQGQSFLFIFRPLDFTFMYLCSIIIVQMRHLVMKNIRLIHVWLSGLLSKLLLASPNARITIADIQKDRWFTLGESVRINRTSFSLTVMKLNWSLCVTAGVEQQPPESGQKFLRLDSGIASRANRLEICVFVILWGVLLLWL